ncbi:MAG TPA: SDR family oxidoreductase [Gaiellaceae bacterium]|nr:SDR family oxidoreductase [Gaiellaceae bacterium]
MSGKGSGVERVALVTGASTGIGRAIAERLQAEGLALGFHSHKDGGSDREAFEEAVARGRAAWVVGDVTEPGVPERLVTETVEALGRLDVLVNNAGVTLSAPALESSADDFDRVFGVNVRGPFLLAIAAAAQMREQGAGGTVVNVTSVHEHVPRRGFALYASSKAALGMLTRSLALELAPEIRVNAVAPGAIATERNEEADALDSQIPVQRPGTPAEVAAAVSWLASEDAAYVSGASLLVDGAMAQQVVESSPA